MKEDLPELPQGKLNELAWKLDRKKGSMTLCQIPCLSGFQEVGLH